MAKRIKRSAEFYKAALKGVKSVSGEVTSYGLRSVADKFTSADGYDLRRVSSWTPSMKARVTRYFSELSDMTAQPRYLFRSSNKAKLQEVQRISGHDSGYKFNVAFIPHTPKTDASGKEVRPRVKVLKGGISIVERGYTKSVVEFNMRRLAKDSKSEVARTVALVPNAKRFAVQAGLNEMSGLFDKELIHRRVSHLMHLYDGKKALPRSSGNRGDKPKSHRWNLWLNGLIAYEFPRLTRQAVSRTMVDFDKARRDLQKRKKALRKKLRK